VERVTAADYGYLRQLVLDHSQNVLDPAHDYLFETRLARVLRKQGARGLGELVRLLCAQKNPLLERAIAEAMTINETSFFRDRLPFELLRKELLPKLIDSRRCARSLRVWSAACSTGQEAYSLAMLILEHFPLLEGWNICIEGTDICAEVVEQAQSGSYDQMEISRGLSESYAARYFDHRDGDWMVKARVRKLCSFRQANLCALPQLFPHAAVRFDIIFARNVMLYFSRDTRRALMAGMHRLIAADGALFLGSAEQPEELSIWKPELAEGTCYFKPRQPS
jgi:chemotaxis protein methyltransferase CheR